MNLNVCINDGTIGRGFFSFFNQVICALDYSDRVGEPLVVDFTKGEYNYGRWEDYFKQPLVISNDLLDYFFHAKRNESVWFPSSMSATFVLTEEEISRGRYLVDKYIRFSERFKEYMNHGGHVLIRKEDQNRTLGVHIRLTDHFLHGELLPIDYYVKQVRQRLNGFTHVYLATDSQNALDRFKMEFGNRLLYQRCIRIDGPRAIQNSKFNPTQIGNEVLLDCINLSQCDYLLKTASNVTHATLFFGKDLKYKNIDSHIKYE
jgi:hypothetical protein